MVESVRRRSNQETATDYDITKSDNVFFLLSLLWAIVRNTAPLISIGSLKMNPVAPRNLGFKHKLD